MNNLYDRQKTLPIRPIKEIAIVGCGGTGSWVALFAALTGVPSIHLFDPDSFEESNFGRIPLPLSLIGQNKSEATASYLKTLRPESSFYTYGRADSFALSSIPSVEIIFDCTDDSSFQEWLEGFCLTSKISYIRCGYNGGDHISVVDKLSKFKTSIPRQSRYEVVPSCAITAGGAGFMAAYKAFLNPSFNFIGGLDELGRVK